MQLAVGARSDVGMVRSGNEDNFFAESDEHRGVFVVADGMGGHAAGEVARRATPEQLDELNQLHDKLEKQVRQRDAFFATKEQFHMKLLELADNRWRTQMVSDLRKVMKLNRHNSLLKSGRIEESLREHQALLEALLKRDVSESVSRMQAHFANGLEAAG